MYAIFHLPTNTIYSMKARGDVTSAVFFRKHDHARRVAEALCAHLDRYGRMPALSDELYLPHPSNARESPVGRLRMQSHDVRVGRRDITKDRLIRFGSRGMGITVVDALFWEDPVWKSEMRHVELQADTETYANTLLLDNDFILDG